MYLYIIYISSSLSLFLCMCISWAAVRQLRFCETNLHRMTVPFLVIHGMKVMCACAYTCRMRTILSYPKPHLCSSQFCGMINFIQESYCAAGSVL